MNRLLLLPLALLSLVLASCGSAGGDDADAMRPATMDGLTLAIGSGGGPQFQFIAFTGKIGDGETGTFNYIRASNDDEGEFTVVSPSGFVRTLNWPSQMTFNNYTMNINGPSSIVLTLTGTPQGSTLFGGPAPTKFTMLLRTNASGFLEVVPNAVIFDDPEATVFFDGILSVTATGGAVPNGYRSERQDQNPDDRDSKIAPGGIDGDVYILTLPDNTYIYLNHGSTTFTAPTPSGATEIGNALFTHRVSITEPTPEEVSYVYVQIEGSDTSRLTLTPTGVNRVMLASPMTITLDYFSSRHGTFILSGGGPGFDGVAGTFVNFDQP